MSLLTGRSPSPLDGLDLDEEAAYRAVSGRDPRFDGRLFVAVLSTGIYCRPSCPSRTPKPENCQFHVSAAACVRAGFRACRRCRPDALPGSREWDVDADLAHRALRLIGDGAVDDHGVAGLARRLAVSERHLHRVLVAQVGASPVQLARTRRAQVARMLVDQTAWSMADVAFAAGFSSIRQFNDVMREEFGAAPSTLRRGATPDPGAPARGADGRATLTVRLRHTLPYDDEAFLAHVGARAVPGLEAVDGRTVRRLVPGTHGPAAVELSVDARGVSARIGVVGLDDVPRVVGRLRHWADLDAEPGRIAEVLAHDPTLAPLVERRPGLRVPGTVDPAELVLRTVLGQQVSVAAARTLTARLVARFGDADASGPDGRAGFTGTPVVAGGGLRAFPSPERIAAAGVDALRELGLTGARAATLVHLAHVLADGLDLGPGADRQAARDALAAVPGVGPWTVEYVALRALGDPDAFPAHDLVLRQALGGVAPAEALRRAEAWRPWRGYAAQHLWTSRSPHLEAR